jgi:hypothetical protein
MDVKLPTDRLCALLAEIRVRGGAFPLDVATEAPWTEMEESLWQQLVAECRRLRIELPEEARPPLRGRYYRGCRG